MTATMLMPINQIERRDVPITSICSNPFRDIVNFKYNESKLVALAESYKTHGFYGVFIVRNKPSDIGKYELVGQHHRFKQFTLSYGKSAFVPIEVHNYSDNEMLQGLVNSDNDIYSPTPSSVLGTITLLIRDFKQRDFTERDMAIEVGKIFGWRKQKTKTESTGSRSYTFMKIALELENEKNRLSKDALELLPTLESAVQFYKQSKSIFWDKGLKVSTERQKEIAENLSRDGDRAVLNLSQAFILEYRRMVHQTNTPQEQGIELQVSKRVLDNIGRASRSGSSSIGQLGNIASRNSDDKGFRRILADQYFKSKAYSEYNKFKEKMDDLHSSMASWVGK